MTYQLPTGVNSTIDKLPSLDKMLSGGLSGHWVVSGVTGIGKTTLAMSFLGNPYGANEGKGSAILDFGMKQGQERYVVPYNKKLVNIRDIAKKDAPLLEETIARLKAEYARESESYWQKYSVSGDSDDLVVPAERKWSALLNIFDLGFFRIVEDKLRSNYSREYESIQREGFVYGEKITSRVREATLNHPSQDIVKLSLLPEDIGEYANIYFGRNYHEKIYGESSFGNLQKLMHAWLYHTFKAGDMRRFLLDGITTDIEKTALKLYAVFDGKSDLQMPFVGTNAASFYDPDPANCLGVRQTWRIDRPLSTLSSVTLTPYEPDANISNIDSAITRTQALKIAQEAEGVIVLGNNSNMRYAFDDSLSKAAPQNTRILAIAKSRYGADETFREIILKAVSYTHLTLPTKRIV